MDPVSRAFVSRAVFVCVCVTALSSSWLAASAHAITAERLAGQVDAGEHLTIIDIRSPRAYTADHIPGAINIPAATLMVKRLPPIGRVVICGDGVDSKTTIDALAAIDGRDGIRAEKLDGGMPAWTAMGRTTTRARGVGAVDVKEITLARLRDTVTADGGVVIIDVRSGASDSDGTTRSLHRITQTEGVRRIDLRRPARRSAWKDRVVKAALRHRVEWAGKLLVLIDDGDGRGEVIARRLRAAGATRVVTLVGGERALAAEASAD